MKKLINRIVLATIISSAAAVAQAQDNTETILGTKESGWRADDVPAGEQGRYYVPGAAAGKDNIYPGSFSENFKLGAKFKAGYSLSCGDLDFYSNINAEIQNLKYKMQNVIKSAQASILTSISSALTSFFQYLLSKINPTLGQLSIKQLDEYIEIFELNVKQCQDYEKDVKNGKNPLGEIVQVAVGDQWQKTIGLVNSGSVSLQEAEEKLVKDAKKNGVTMADGEQYGGENQDPVNITKSLIIAGMNLIVGRADKNQWEQPFSSSDEKENPILREFEKPEELYEFVESIYGATEKTISESTASGESVKTVSGRGYEKKYTEYRNEYIENLRKYINREFTRKEFEEETGNIIPPAEIDDIRTLPPYQKSVEIEQRSQQYAIKRIKNNLILAKQSLKTGIYAPDMQQSGMKGPAMREYKMIYYRILDDLSEISQRAYQY